MNTTSNKCESICPPWRQNDPSNSLQCTLLCSDPSQYYDTVYNFGCTNCPPGFGVDMFVTKNLFLRAEYTYMFGPKITVKQDIRGYDNTVFAGDYVVHKFQITQQTFKVGVGYKF